MNQINYPFLKRYPCLPEAKMKLIKIFLIIFFISGFFANNTFAQYEKQAQVGFRFLANPVSAEVMGRGGVGIINIKNSSGIFWNPSLISLGEHDYDISLNHTKGIADINYNAIAVSANLFDFGTLGFSLMAMDYGEFHSTVRAANSQGYIDMGVFSPTAIALGTAFSQRISEKFSYGIHLKYARQDLGDAYVAVGGDSLSNVELGKKRYDKDVLALDVGAYYDFQFNGMTFGAAIQNISRELYYENEKFPLPFAISFGTTIKPLDFFMQNDPENFLILSFESVHPRDFGEKYKIGAEYNFMNMFIARAGYQMNYDERDYTAGLGVRYPLSGVPLRIDYAFEPFGILGNVHFISIGISY
jgi:hypothetical protein